MSLNTEINEIVKTAAGAVDPDNFQSLSELIAHHKIRLSAWTALLEAQSPLEKRHFEWRKSHQPVLVRVTNSTSIDALVFDSESGHKKIAQLYESAKSAIKNALSPRGYAAALADLEKQEQDAIARLNTAHEALLAEQADYHIVSEAQESMDGEICDLEHAILAYPAKTSKEWRLKAHWIAEFQDNFSYDSSTMSALVRSIAVLVEN